MKRKSIILCLLTLLLLIPVLAQAAPVGKFTNIEGNVDVTAPGKEAVKANMGDPLNTGDIIRTKSKAKAEVVFIDGSVLRLAENSRLRVSEFSLDNEKRNATLNLFRGKIQNTVKALSGAGASTSKYEVHTPTAVCGVRGTNFFTYYQSGVSGTVVTEGTVYGYSANKPGEVRTIGPNQAMIVTDPNLPPTVRAATPAETEQHQKDTTPAEKPKEEAKKEEEKKSDSGTAKTEEGQQEEGKKEDAKEEGQQEDQKQDQAATKDDKQTDDKSTTAKSDADQGSEGGSTGTSGDKGQGQTGGGQPEEGTKTVVASGSADANENAGPVDIVPKETAKPAPSGGSATAGTVAAPARSVDQIAVPIFENTTITFGSGPTGGGGTSGPGNNLDINNNQGTGGNPGGPAIPGTPNVVQTQIDTNPPPLPVVTGLPTGITNLKSAPIQVANPESGAAYEYSTNGGQTWTTLNPGGTTIDLAALGEGQKTILFRGADTAGNTTKPADYVSYNWTQYYTLPTISLSQKPAPITSQNSANIGVTVTTAGAIPATTTYTLDGVAVSSLNLTGLSEGSHTLVVTSTDTAGNTSTEGYTWKTDYTAPVLTLSGAPAGTTSSNSESIGVSADEQVTYTFILNGAPVTSTQLTDLPEGENVLIITATDPAGLTTTETISWRTDYPTPVSGSVAVNGVLSSGSLAAEIDDSTNEGTLTFSGTAAPAGLPAGSWGGTTGGDLGDDKYSGFLTGVSGSWEGLLSGIYVTGSGEAGYLTGDLAGTYEASSNTLSGAGTIKRSGVLGLTELAPDALANSLEELGVAGGPDGDTGFPLPLPGSIVVGGAISPSVTGEGKLLGIRVANPENGRNRILGVWGTTTTDGLYTNATGAAGWQGVYGRSGSFNTDPADAFFMLGNISGTDDGIGHVSIAGELAYLENYQGQGYLGRIDLAYRGKYEAVGASLTPDNSPYSSAGAGTFTLDPLTFGGSITDGSFHFLQDGLLSAGSLSGLWGGTDDLASGAATLWAMGKYSGQLPGNALFTADMDGYTAPVGNMVSAGFVGGRVVNSGVEADFAGLYLRPLTGGLTELGFLNAANSNSLFSGTDSGFWMVSGGMAAAGMEESAGASISFASTDDSQTFAVPLASVYLGGPAVNLVSERLRSGSFSGRDWGIFQTITEGTYDSAFLPTDGVNTAWSIDHNSVGHADTLYQASAATWNLTDNALSGSTVLALAGWDEGQTYVGGGSLKGTLDTAAWGAVTTGAWMETGRFLQMAGSATVDANATLRALNIPAVLVGQATLTQSDPSQSVNNLTNLSLDNVGFFATSTGSAPRLWATGNVTGNYDPATPPASTGPVVRLSSGPGGLDAYFGIRNWNPDAGVWGANVIGGGTLNGGSYSGGINLAGGAAGLFGSGSLTGTAAGVTAGYPISTDSTAPVLSFTQQPAGITNSHVAGFTVASNESGANYLYSIDGSTYQPLLNGMLSLDDLSEGQHTLTVPGTDAAGNLSVASYTWTTDYTPPTASFLATPFPQDDLNNIAAPAFTALVEPGTQSRYKLDDGVFNTASPDGTILLDLTGLPDGPHILTVEAIDAAGNISTPITYTWTTDRTPPAITLAGTPRKVSGNDTAEFMVTADDIHPGNSYYRVDEGEWQLFDGSALTGISEGRRKIEFKADDLAGNESTPDAGSSYEWFIGKRQYVLTGSVTGDLSGSVLDSSEGIRAITGGNNGAWLLDLGGSYETAPASVRLAAGGQGFGPNNSTLADGYWLSRIDGSAADVDIIGTSTLTYLSTTTLGQGAGTVTGSLGDGLWQLRDLGFGTYTETPLVLSGTVTAPDWAFMLPSGSEVWDGSMTGRIGGTVLPWGGNPLAERTLLALGVYGNRQDSRAWWSMWVQAGTEAIRTTDDGALLGDMLGVIRPDEGAEGFYGALFVRPDGDGYKGGYIGYDVAGNFYPGASTPGSGLWELTGTPYAFYEQPVTGITPDQLNGDNITYRHLYGSAAGDIAVSEFKWLEFLSLPGQHWGYWPTAMAGSLVSLPAGPWQARAGGTIDKKMGATYLAEDGYWLAELSGDAWSGGAVNGNVTFRYLTRDAKGTFGNRLLGAYQSSETGYNWQAVSGGVYTETPLTFSGTADGGLLYSNDGGYLTEGGHANGLLGGTATAPPWSGASTDVYLMGRYTDSFSNARPYLMYGSGWYFNGGTLSGTATDEGAFSGYMVGLWKDGNIRARVLSLYITPEQKAGYLEGEATGNYYAALGIWEATGALIADPGWERATAVNATDLSSSLTANYFEGYSGRGAFSAEDGGIISVRYAAGDPLRISDQDWGIWNAGFGGVYSGAAADSWRLVAGGSLRSAQWDVGERGYWFGSIAGAQWADGEIAGAFTATGLTNEARYDFYDGSIAGFYDEAGVWQAAGIGLYNRTPTDLGGDWYNSTLYNGNGNLSWNSEGSDSGAFGFLKRSDGNYDFLAIGDFVDYGIYDALENLAFGGPYLWSGSLWYAGNTGNRYLEGFTAGIKEKRNPGAESGAMTGYAAALYYTEDGKVGLIEGGLTGSSYEMDESGSVVQGMWKVESDANGLAAMDKTDSLTADFDPAMAGVDTGSLTANADGGFGNAGAEVGTVRGGYNNGKAKFIAYDIYDALGVWIDTKSLPFGIYNLKLGAGGESNFYTGKPADASVSWNAKIGGDGNFGYESGYWLADLTGAWDSATVGQGTINGVLDGNYLTPTHMGTISGPLYGLYNEDGVDEFGGYGTWSGASVGAWNGVPLSFASEVYGDLVDGSGLNIGSLQGVLGGTASLWTATETDPAPATMMGQYIPAGDVPHLWTSELYSHNYNNDSHTTYDSGAYRGFLGGVEVGGSMDERLLALYIAPDGSAGYLKGSLTGTADREIKMFAMDGGLYPTPVASGIEVAPADLYDSIWKTSSSMYYDYYDNTLVGTFAGGGEINARYRYGEGGSYGYANMSTMSMVNYEKNKPAPWGIYAQSFVGTYADPGATWTAKAGGYNAFGAYRAANYHSGNYGYADGGNYSYNYYTDNRSGDVSYRRADATPSYDIHYNPDGSFTKTTYSYDAVSGYSVTGTETGTWDTATPLAALVATPADSNTAAFSENKYGVGEDDHGYWLADISDGAWSGSKLTGRLNGKFLTYTKLGTLTGDVRGVYNAADNTWQGAGLGAWSGTDLQFVNPVSAGLTSVTRYYTGSYSYADGGSYSFNYYTDNQSGSLSYIRPASETSPAEDYTITYGGDGIYTKTSWDELGNPTTTTGNWQDEGHASLAFLGTPLYPAAEPVLDSSNDYAVSQADGSITDGLLGGTSSLWSASALNPAAATLIGQYIPGASGSHTWNTIIRSYNYKDGSYTTYDGGAYKGYLAGTKAGESMEGRLWALYIAPLGQAGYLKGSLTGTAYPEIKMFALDGTVYAETPVEAAIGIAPGDLDISVIETGDNGNKLLSATLGTDGKIWADNLSLDTMSLVQDGFAQTWGIYRQDLGGRFTADASTGATWSGMTGGGGYIGAFNNNDGGISHDYGYWLADVAGTLASGKLSGDLTGGRFITGTRLGTLSGELFGLYNTGNSTWQGAGLGAWSGTDLQFVNPLAVGMTSVTRHYAGSYSYANGGSYSFEYYTDNQAGSISYLRPELGENYTVSYYGDGTYTKTSWDESGNPTTTTGNWLEGHTSLSFLGTPVAEATDEVAPILNSSSDLAVTLADGSVTDALLGGTASLWSATSLTPAMATLIGQYVPGASASHVWNATVQSYNYKAGTYTTYDGGAYKGYLVGTKRGNGMDSSLLALYIDPSGQTGYLKGSLTGTAYPAIKMFVLDGTVYTETPVDAASGIAPGALIGSVVETGDWGNKALSATLGADGQIWTDSQSLYTMSLIKDNAAQNWGIYRQELYGRFTPDSSVGTTWSGLTGGGGYICAISNDGGVFSDYGYWLANVAGTLTDGKLSGDLTGGRFITGTRLGDTLNGELFGVYNASDNTWQAAGLGTWSGTALTFNGDVSGGLTYFEEMEYGGFITNVGNIVGLIGGTGDLFASTPVATLMMGSYSTTGTYTGPALISGNDWYISGATGVQTPDSADDSAFRGYLAGIWDDGEIERAKALTLAVRSDGRAGVVSGNLTGSYYAEIKMWEASGNLAFTDLGSTIVAPSDLAAPASLWSGSLTGVLAGGSVLTSIETSYLQGTLAGLADQNWGIWTIGLGGAFAGTPTGTYQIGGGISADFGSGAESGYWLSDAVVAWNDDAAHANRLGISLNNGRFLTETAMGEISTTYGGVVGTYEDPVIVGPITIPGTWQAAGVGYWGGATELKFVSDLQLAGWGGAAGGSLTALMGGTSSLWTGGDAPITIMGEFSGGNGLWPSPVFSWNFKNDSYTTYDATPGAYRGFNSLVMDDLNGVDGRMIALYVDPSGNAGYLTGTLSGDVYPSLGRFDADGSVKRLEVGAAPVGVTATNFADNVTMPAVPEFLFFEEGSFDPLFLSEERNAAWITGDPSWGIWQSLLELGTEPASWSWTTISGTDATYWTNYNDVTWAADTAKLAGDVAGAKVHWVSASTYVHGGEIKGLFDPTAATWKAVAQGAWMETGKFIDMASTDSGRAALQALNIPAVQVGQDSLFYGDGSMTVSMNNVTFFASSVGTAPKIWATENVSGTYTPMVSPLNQTVLLTGSTLTANFTMQRFDEGNSKWGAAVTNGTGVVAGQTVQFQGGAAGTINTPGTFSGTGAGVAGVVKP